MHANERDTATSGACRKGCRILSRDQCNESGNNRRDSQTRKWSKPSCFGNIAGGCFCCSIRVTEYVTPGGGKNRGKHRHGSSGEMTKSCRVILSKRGDCWFEQGKSVVAAQSVVPESMQLRPNGESCSMLVEEFSAMMNRYPRSISLFVFSRSPPPLQSRRVLRIHG